MLSTTELHPGMTGIRDSGFNEGVVHSKSLQQPGGFLLYFKCC